MASSFFRFLDHTRRIRVCRTPLDEGSARRRDLYLTIHNIYNRQTSMPPEGFEPTISAVERPQTYASDRAATGSGKQGIYFIKTCQFQGKLISGNKIQLYANKNKDINCVKFQLASVHLPQILTTCLLNIKVKCLARNPDVKQKILENGILSGSRIVYVVEVWSL